MARRIPYQRAAGALRKAEAGQSLSRHDQLALDNLQTRLGLPRPLTSYAPRTQRRYLKAAREGVTAHDINSAENARRANALTGAARLRRIEELRLLVYNSTVEQARQVHTPDHVQDLIDLYGAPAVLDLYIGQVNAIRQYSAGHKAAGHSKWNGRRDFLSRYRSDVMELDEEIDPHFYYHGSLAN